MKFVKFYLPVLSSLVTIENVVISESSLILLDVAAAKLNVGSFIP